MDTSQAFEILVTFGGLFLLGLLADLIGRNSILPRVTLLMISGFVIGPSVLDWLPPFTDDWFPVLTNVALTMIGFLLGQKLTLDALKTLGRPVLYMSLGEVLGTALLVTTVLAAFGTPVEIAMLLGGIAPATAPAATVDTVHQVSARGKFTDTLLGIVAVDDAWGLIMFSLLLAAVQVIAGTGSPWDAILLGVWEVFGALALGVVVGLPMAFLTGRLSAGEPTQAEALGFVLICAGLAVWADVSHILAAMALGATVASLARHHQRPFHEIEGIEWPFLVLFFLLAGAKLHVGALGQVGLIGGGYIVLRASGLNVGAYVGGALAGVDATTRRWMGMALLPQAGVALGIVLLAVQTFPEYENILLPVVLGSTVVFELIGPVATRWALARTDQIKLSEG